MFSLSKSIQPIFCTSNNRLVNKRKAHLVKTQKILQNNLYDKIELVKQFEKCNPNNNSLNSGCYQMWDEIEELSRVLSKIRFEIKSIEKDDCDINLKRNLSLLSTKKSKLDL
jgi:hypothetical protein